MTSLRAVATKTDLEIAIITTWVLYENSWCSIKIPLGCLSEAVGMNPPGSESLLIIVQPVSFLSSLALDPGESWRWLEAHISPNNWLMLKQECSTLCALFCSLKVDKPGLNYAPEFPVSPAKAETPPHCYPCYSVFPFDPVLHQQLANCSTRACF